MKSHQKNLLSFFTSCHTAEVRLSCHKNHDSIVMFLKTKIESELNHYEHMSVGYNRLSDMLIEVMTSQEGDHLSNQLIAVGDEIHRLVR